MARGRMIDNCISISERINDLSLREAFIYTWVIPHLDDWGRITGSPRTLKALIFPMKKEISIRNIEDTLTKFKELGLFLWEEVNGEMVLQMPFKEFNSHQAISDSKRAKSKYPEIIEHKNDISQEIPEIPKNPQEIPAQDNIREFNLNKDYIAPSNETLPEADLDKNDYPKEPIEEQKENKIPKTEISFNFDKEKWEGLKKEDFTDWLEAYPLVDFERELVKAKEWVVGNLNKSRHKKKWRQFLNNWFTKAQTFEERKAIYAGSYRK